MGWFQTGLEDGYNLPPSGLVAPITGRLGSCQKHLLEGFSIVRLRFCCC